MRVCLRNHSRAKLQSFSHHFKGTLRTEKQNLRLWRNLHDLLGGDESIDPWQLNIQQNNVRLQ